MMFLGFPFWFRAASLRAGSVFDAAAQTGIAFILPSVAFLIVWAFLSAIGADVPFRAGRSIVSLAGAIAVYVLILGTITKERMDAYLRIACFTLALTCLASLIALADPALHQAIYRYSDRASGFFKNPNQLGIAISTLMPVAIGYFFIAGGRRLFWGLCVSLFLVGLVLSGSKTNLLLSAVTTGVMILSASYIVNTGSRRLAMVVLGLCIYAVIIAIGFLLLNTLNPRAVKILTNFFSPDIEVQSLQSRSILWQYSIDQFMADPFFGEGAGQPLKAYDSGRQVAHSHNIILDFLRTLGLPGLLGFLIIAITTAILSFGSMIKALTSKTGAPRARIIVMGLAVGSVTYLVANAASDSMGPSTSPFFWTVLFLCLANRRYLLRAPEPIRPTSGGTGGTAPA